MEELRAQFPVLERVAYLNAGTNGPVPRRAFDAAEASLREQLEQGRSSRLWFARQIERIDSLRERAAGLLGATQADVAITGSTTDGINAVLHALDLKPGDELLTTDEEHPGVLAPLATARDTRGVTVREVPFGELPDEVRPDTRVVVTSHVSWATGRVMDTAPLAASGALVVLDGAQGLGAVPGRRERARLRLLRRVRAEVALRPDGHRLPVREPGARAGPAGAMERLPRARVRRARARCPRSSRTRGGSPRASRFRTTSSGRTPRSTCSRRPGFDAVHEAAIAGAERLAELLRERGVEVAPRGTCTLVSFAVPDPEAFTQEAATQGLVIRFLPGRPWARASVGAWNTDEELERLADLAAAAG